MNLKLLSACLLMLGAAPPHVPSRPQVTVDPNDPEKTRTIVSREEREKLGLTPRSWNGVVHPDVYSRLDRLNQTVTSLKDRLKKGKDVQAFDALWRVRFEGMVYVQVGIKSREAQRSVLASLKASEFHAPFLFQKSAGLTGFVTKEGLDKLATNAEVTGICLDDNLLPEKSKTIYKSDLPPIKPGEVANEPGVAEGKVDPDVYRAFALSDRVDVMVSLRGDTLPKPADVPSEMREREALREQEVRKLQDRVLSKVNADEFWIWTRTRGGMGISGYIDREGLAKLHQQPEVQKIYLPLLMRTSNTIGTRNRTP